MISARTPHSTTWVRAKFRAGSRSVDSHSAAIMLFQRREAMDVMEVMTSLVHKLNNFVFSLRLLDVVDILVVAYLIYRLLLLVRKTNSSRLPCMGALTKKMFFSSSEETSASSLVPLRRISSVWFFRSKTISGCSRACWW